MCSIECDALNLLIVVAGVGVTKNVRMCSVATRWSGLSDGGVICIVVGAVKIHAAHCWLWDHSTDRHVAAEGQCLRALSGFVLGVSAAVGLVVTVRNKIY